MTRPPRILLLADSHLGFDLPARPRIERRRRGEDFFANYARALKPASEGVVDIVVHGGDVFHRPRPSDGLARRALQPLLEVADRGVPVFVVPGNHERAVLPACFVRYRGVRVFDRPRTFVVEVRGVRVALAGFPYVRRSIRTRFAEVLRATGAANARADVTLLCMHHCVEGATVGPGDFTFTRAPDVVRCRDLPAAYAAVLSGHIHRRQVLTTDLRGRPLAVPVIYPGSIERTSVAEIGEEKGLFMVDVELGGARPSVRWHAEPLPARPMLVRTLALSGLGEADAERALRAVIAAAPADAVLRLRVTGADTPGVRRVLAAGRVRALAPATMNVEIADPARFRERVPRGRPRTDGAMREPAQLDLLALP